MTTQASAAVLLSRNVRRAPRCPNLSLPHAKESILDRATGMGGLSCGRTKLGGCYYIEHLALSRPQGRRIESEVGFEEIIPRSPRTPFLDQEEASNGFLDYFQIAENPGAIASWHES